MKGYPRPSPYEIGEADPKVPYAPEEDVGETVAWCDRCGAERRFVREQVDVSRAEERSEMPSVYHAIEGETGWVCQTCGEFRRDLIAEAGYDYEYSNVGYHVRQFEDEEETVREASSEGVTPPERVRDYPVEPGEEAASVDPNRDRAMRERERFARLVRSESEVEREEE